MLCVSCLLGVMAKCRREGRSNNQTFVPGVTFYGKPVLRVLDTENNILLEEVWENSLSRIDYLIDVAEQVHGMLLVAQPVCRFDGRAGLRLDEGFEVQVYPDFALREGAEFVAIDEDEHHNQEDEPIEDRPLDN